MNGIIHFCQSARLKMGCLLVVFLWSWSLQGQIYHGNLTLSTQAEVDAFDGQK
ncbi:MAG: hypothetical protein R3B93_07280 [Bacteroidia bacterium]